MTAPELYEMGRKAERRGDIVKAYLLYSQAAAADPNDRRSWLRSQALRTRAASIAKVMPPQTVASNELPLGGTAQEREPIPPELLEEAPPKLEPPVELKPKNTETRGFEITGNSREVWEQVLKAYGLEPIFDADYTPVPRVRFKVEDMSYRDVMYAVGAATNSFFTPVSESLVLVAQDTPQKRGEVENTAVVEVPIPETLTVQDAVELSRLVQQTLDITKHTINTAQRVVIFRDRVSKLGPAVQLFRELAKFRSEVVIEVEFLSIARNNLLKFGILAPTSTPLLYLLDRLAGFTAIRPNALPRNVATIGTWAGAPIVGIAIGGTQLLAEQNRSDIQAIYRATLRTSDTQQAAFHVGDRYPIATSGFVNLPSSPHIPLPFNFEDLGFILKIQTRVHSSEELTIGFEAELKSLGGMGENNLPIINNRKFTEQVRLRFDESVVIAGLVNSQHITTIAGLAGFLDIPFVGPLFSDNSRDNTNSEALIILKPRLVSLPPGEYTTRTIWTGSETRPRPAL